ncbi:MAG: 4a-hydroxytetrahydrobiopterin dehydratase [Planctomycetaceae bacterium]
MSQDVVLSAAEIAQALQTLPGWEEREGWLVRKFKTPGWPHTLMLVNTIGYVAEAADHHPDLEVGYAQVKVKIQTHRVLAITASDVALAAQIESVALWQPATDSPLAGYPKKWVH